MGKNLGFGAMISVLSGNEKSAAIFQKAIGKTITGIALDDEENDGDGGLVITFAGADPLIIVLYDDARSCCEHRYMHTDDDLVYHVGAQLLSGEVKEVTREDMEHGDVKETAFLVITTSKGQFTINTYNEHNGYYGGISIRVRELIK